VKRPSAPTIATSGDGTAMTKLTIREWMLQ
jgi:hypothetical protein